MSAYQIKSIPASVKDIDSKSRMVTGYFSTFGAVDSDMDMIMPGAFSKSIQENGPESMRKRIVHLYQHDVNLPLAKPKVLKEDEMGLYFESEIVKTSYGEDVLKLYEAGVINEHSIGFSTIKAQPKGDYTEINEVRLYEGSTVTFGANENTPFMGFKGMDKSTALERVQKLTKAVRNGTFKDETFHLLEIQLRQLEQFIHDTLDQKAEPVSTSPQAEPDDVYEALDNFTTSLKLSNWRP
jgi:hypothetical protein